VTTATISLDRGAAVENPSTAATLNPILIIFISFNNLLFL
jgi:hypothetical protein